MRRALPGLAAASPSRGWRASRACCDRPQGPGTGSRDRASGSGTDGRWVRPRRSGAARPAWAPPRSG
eukprot:12667278-Alexandrium_andersonii.AAC.1